jgi:tRNA (cytidine/uridine-2'-O-)-methyltransferase
MAFLPGIPPSAGAADPADHPGTVPYHRFAFAADDTIVLGRESAGVPPEVHAASAARLIIPMRQGLRSLNVALAAAMVLGEALRQTGLFPGVEA